MLCITLLFTIRDFHNRISVQKANTNSRATPFSSNAIISKDPKLNPYFIVGFVDAEGCFSIKLKKNKKMKLGWSIYLTFEIHLHRKDRELLTNIREVLGRVGTIYDGSNKSILYSVGSLSEIIHTIIPFFDKYCLLSKKSIDYELFRKAALIMDKKEHLTEKGFYQILSIKAAMRNGLTEVLAESFPNISPVFFKFNKPLPEVLNPYWIAGFTEGEGSFMIHIQKHEECKTGKAVKLKFQITQHEKDKELLNLILMSFNCGTLITNNNSKVFAVWKFEDVFNIIIPFFQNYSLQGNKKLNFLDFIKVAHLIKNKAHLTVEGLDKIESIKSGMHYGRDN